MTIRVLIADDSSLARGLLRAILEREPDIEVVGEATDGRRAVELAQSLRPSLVTLDLEMPGMNGFEAIAAIMRVKALPILVVSSQDDAAKACEALRLGALDVIAKPDDTPASHKPLIEKIRLLADMVVATRRRAPPADTATKADPQARGERADKARAGSDSARARMSATDSEPDPGASTHPASLAPRPRMVAIAASTGGPQALAKILGALPGDFPAPILIAQHIAEGFSAGLAQWLSLCTRLPVRLAEHGGKPRPGQVYLAPSETNLMLAADGRLALRERASRDIYRPNCDLLLSTVAEHAGARAIGLILTGMSSDGAAGIAAIRAAGGITLAQDAESSVVFGMNRVAIEAGSVARVLPLAELGPTLERLARDPG